MPEAMGPAPESVPTELPQPVEPDHVADEHEMNRLYAEARRLEEAAAMMTSEATGLDEVTLRAQQAEAWASADTARETADQFRLSHGLNQPAESEAA